jgi:hypothetical protein
MECGEHGNRTYMMINFYGENLILFLKMMKNGGFWK